MTAELTEAEFVKFAQLIEQEVGIHLSDAKKPLLVARLGKRVRRLALATFSEYFDHVAHDADERVAMFDAISTNETRFFREPKHFELLNTRLLPAIRAAAANGERPKSLRIWSAGCSTGEEPYSLAMTLLEQFDPFEWDLRIDATDLSTRVLDVARTGQWPMRKAAEIPKPLLRRFMLRGTGTQHETFSAGQELRSIIRFGRVNLTDAHYPMPTDYDLILCRNVLIYFTNAMRRRVVTNLLDHLAAGGSFFIGHAETLAGIVEGPRTVIPTVYVK
ncbi:MAG TPA: protein-glutamate O-methyltransferase CheR [Thermoanaerobaculia bacterium]|nr:protein-glutamate O-methyltransferase CheR [Thermoanaerobaculia bacterium]